MDLKVIRSVKISPLFSNPIPIVALYLLLLVCSGALNGALGSPISNSRSLSKPAISSSFQDSFAIEREHDDTSLLSPRDLAPDVLATAVPVPSHSRKTKLGLYPENKNLHLRTSFHNVSGINGFRLFSLPIQVNELTNLLSATYEDLKVRDSVTKTPYYQFNSTKWSFAVITANQSMHYIYIQAIVSRFAKLTSSSSSFPTDLTSSPVGVMLNGSDPVANVLILPLFNGTNNAYTPFSSFGNRRNKTSSTEPVEIAILTPTENTCAYRILNETAILAPYAHPLPAAAAESALGLPLRHRSLEAEIMRPVLTELFQISYRLWHRPDGIPVEVSSTAIISLCFIALARLLFDDLKLFMMRDFLLDDENLPLIDGMWSLDTGWFEMGRMAGRLVVQTNRRHGLVVMANVMLRLVIRLIGLLLMPYTFGLSIAWGMEGYIYEAPNRTELYDWVGTVRANGMNGTNGGMLVEVGRWELSFWDNQ